MTKIQDMATITRTNLERAGSTDTASRAYMVWLSAVNSPKLRNHPSDVNKFEYRGTFRSILLDLYPELAPAHMSDELERVSNDVYAYLRSSGNARCTSRGSREGHGVIWEIASTWTESNAPATSAIRARRAPQPTRAEKKLTPKEAGEDRKAAPVVVTHIEPKDASMTTTVLDGTSRRVKAFEEARSRHEAEHRDLVELIYLTVSGQNGEPVTVHEVAHEFRVHETTARKALDELVGAGRLFTRFETSEDRFARYAGQVQGQRARLFSSVDPVPARTKRVVVDGYIASVAPQNDRRVRGTNSERILEAARSRYETATVVGKRAGVKTGSIDSSLRQLVDSGHIEKSSRSIRGRSVSVYRKTAQVVHTESPAAPVAPLVTDSRSRAIAAVEALLAQSGDSIEIERLTNELATAQARIAELEKALAPLQALLGRS